MAEILVRPALERDYHIMARIQQACPQAAQWPVGDYSNYNVLLAIADGVAAGFCAWRTVAHGESELLNLAVDPGRRRQGVASALLRELQARAECEIFLEVAGDNAAALGLYESHGWKRIGTRRTYYERGGTDAIVMKKRSW